MIRSRVGSLLVLAVCEALIAVAAGLDEEDRMPLGDLSCEIRRWGLDEGLPRGRVEDLTLGPDGYLWISGDGYIARFNGQRFESFDLNQLSDRKFGTAGHLVFDDNGVLWFSCHEDGLWVRQDGRFLEVKSYPKSQEQVADLVVQSGGGVFVSSEHKHSRDHRILSIADPNDDVVKEIGPGHRRHRISQDGRIWVLFKERDLRVRQENTRVGNLYELESGNLRRAELDGARVLTFVDRFDGTLTVLTEEGLFVYRSDAWVRERAISFPDREIGLISSACEDSRGLLFLYVPRDGIHVVGTTGIVQPISSLSGISLPRSITENLVADLWGNVWIPSHDGLYQLRYTPAVTLALPAERRSARVHSVSEDASGAVWLSIAGGVCVKDETFELRRRLNPAERWLVVGDPLDGVWMCGRSGTVRLERDGQEAVTERLRWDGEHAVLVTGLVVDSEGGAWISTNRGLFHCDPNRDFTFFQDEVGDDGGHENVVSLAIGREDHLYAGVEGRGIYRRDADTGEWTRFSQSEDALAKMTGSLEVDAEGRLWGLSKSLNSIGCWTEEESLRAEGSALNLGGDLQGGLAFDHIGGIWIATHRNGVAHVERSELLAKLRDPVRELKVTWFDRRHGLGSKRGPFGQEGVHCARDGRIWVATAKGPSVFNPRLLRQEKSRSVPPLVLIERVMEDGRELRPPKKQPWRLPVGTEEIRIHSAALDFGKPGEARYRYRLHGLNGDWIDGGAESLSVFQRLPPGDYRFEVLARNRFGVESDRPASLAFVVLPQWWERLSTKIAAILLMTGILVILYRRRMAAFRRRHEVQAAFSKQIWASQEGERKRIAGELHDGLSQFLVLITNSIRLAQLKVDKGSSEWQGLEEVCSTAGTAMEEVRYLINELRPAELDRSGLLVATQLMIERVAEHEELNIDPVFVGLHEELPEGEKIAIYRLIQEGLNNVVKHAEVSTVTVEAVREDSMVHIQITDDGLGLDLGTERRKAVERDLARLSERVSLLEGRLTSEAGPERGTRVKMSVPLSSFSI